jgi:hypothetical protein
MGYPWEGKSVFYLQKLNYSKNTKNTPKWKENLKVATFQTSNNTFL